MHSILEKFTRTITYTLLITAMIFISFQTIELVWETCRSFGARFGENGLHGLDYNPAYGKTIIVLFFNVMLALEILETIRIFNHSHSIKVRIILLICLIAVSRKIFVLDMQEANPMEDIGIAALMLTLSVSYFLVSKQANIEGIEEDKKTTKS